MRLTSATTALRRLSPDDLRAFVPDPDALKAYPIVTYSWILAYTNYDDPAKAGAMRQVLAWCLTEGQHFSEELGYVPLPESAIAQVMAALERIEL